MINVLLFLAERVDSVSSSRKVVVIGGVAGGMSAATRLRRLDEHAEIVVLERGGFVSFANCGLPYHLSGTISDRSSLILQNPQSLAARFGLDVRVKSDVTAIDLETKTLTVFNLETKEEYTELYDFLVLSPGAKPLDLSVPGDDRAMPMRDMADLDRAMAWLGSKPESAVILGAGFIGLEIAENLIKSNISTTVVHRGTQVMTPLDPEMAISVALRMRASGVDLRLHTTITSITKNSVVLSTGEEIAADLVFNAIGVSPDIALAQSAGLRIGPNGGIWVDENQRTSDPSVFAVGDAAEKIDAITGQERLVPLAGLANRHGQQVANQIVGATPVPATPALGTAIVSFDGLAAAYVGWNEKSLSALGKRVRVIHTHPANHAGYYPGAQTMRLKLLVDPETDLILGAQAVGGDGVDKRIDVIATAMFAKVPASQLAQLELAYDPQHGSAKDPINMLGYINRNIAQGLTKTIEWHELNTFRADGATLIDVRTPGEFKAGNIPGSINIPLDTLRDNLSQFEGERLVVTCQVGQRGHTAARILSQEGFDVYNLDGGYLTWKAGIAALSLS